MPESVIDPVAEPQPGTVAKPRRAGRRDHEKPLIPARILNEYR